MKKLFINILILEILLCNISSTFASKKQTYIEYISDDIYVEYIIEESPLTKTTYTKSGKKTANVKNGNTLLWSVTVHGTFEYTGSTSICTKSTVSTTCPDTRWKISSQSASKSGATATGKATGKRYNNGVAVETYTQSVFLVCGSDGTLY